MATIEFVTIQITGSAFHAHYIGARSTSDCAYKRGQSPLSELADFKALLERSGFTFFNESSEGDIVSYMRKGSLLTGGIAS